MKTNSELKNRAIDALTGNWGLGAVITLVYGLVMNAPTPVSYTHLTLPTT